MHFGKTRTSSVTRFTASAGAVGLAFFIVAAKLDVVALDLSDVIAIRLGFDSVFKMVASHIG